MKFGSFPIDQCEGAVLAHALQAGAKRFRKGTVLNASALKSIAQAGIDAITVAVMEDGDVGEDEAARRIAEQLTSRSVTAADAGTGRVNLYASVAGVFSVNKECIDRINAVDPAITIATLDQHEPVEAGRMVATVKIIPYAVSETSLAAVEALISQAQVLSVHAYRAKKVGLISTQLPSLKASVIEKTARILQDRLTPSGSQIAFHAKCAHDETALLAAIGEHEGEADILIIFGASAICDEADVIPAALRRAGGRVERLGMPVDPGNLIMLGELKGKPVMGAPGCARSPARNGFDFVLERMLAGIEVRGAHIAAMGVGGLLMEISTRPQPREVIAGEPAKPTVAAIVLAAGQSRRMGSENKLLLHYKGKPIVRHVVEAATRLDGIRDIHVVTGHQADRVEHALAGTPKTSLTHNPNFAEGLSTSLQAGIAALPDDVTHAIILLGDMPFVDSFALKKLLAALENEVVATPMHERVIVATHNAKRANPVIWPRRHFADLQKITGDTGARHLLSRLAETVVEVEIGSAGAIDVDTPQAYRQLIDEPT